MQIQVSLKCDKNNEYFTRRPNYIYDTIIIKSSYDEKVSEKSCRENQNTHFMFNNIFFFYENHAVYEIMWKNIVEPGWPQMKIWRMYIACWVTEATNTHSEYVIIIAFPLKQWLHGRPSVLRYTYTVRVFESPTHAQIYECTIRFTCSTSQGHLLVPSVDHLNMKKYIYLSKFIPRTSSIFF